MITPQDITGMVLAGGRGSRMGGVDKGLQLFQSTPLALHVLQRLRPQVGHCMINANRNLEIYAQFGVPVHADSLTDYAGPLAGFVSGLQHCQTPWLLAVPCDSPGLPLNLAARMAQTACAQQARIVLAAAPELQADGSHKMRSQPVFALIHTALLQSLKTFVEGGGRKIDLWTSQQDQALCYFNRPEDDPHAFANANTLQELKQLEQHTAPL